MVKSKIGEVDREVGNRIRTQRAALGLSLREVAERLGVSSTQLQKYESGDNQLTPARIRRLCDTLALSPNQLFGYGEKGGGNIRLSVRALKVARIVDQISPPQARIIHGVLSTLVSLTSKQQLQAPERNQ